MRPHLLGPHARSVIGGAALVAALLMAAGQAAAAPTGAAPPPRPASAPRGAIPPNPAASAGGMSEAVARCEAKTSAVERARCRRDLAQQAPAARP